MRNPVACVSCRSAKQKCTHNGEPTRGALQPAVSLVGCSSANSELTTDAPPCDRCKAAGRADLCEFPPPGTSAIHRRPKRPRQDDATPPTASSLPTHPYRSAPGASPTVAAPAQHSPTSTASLLDGLDPFDLLTDEVKNSYLRCSYKWSFHHTPSLLLGIRDRTLEIWMVWAMLALAIRYAPWEPISGPSYH